MANYMQLVRDNLKEYSKYGKTEIADHIEKMMAWSANLRKAGVHRGAEKLTDDPGQILRFKNGQIIVDGPFTEAKELIGGFFLIEAKDDNHAAEIARDCPSLRFGSEIELRKVADVCSEVVMLRGK